MKRNQRRKQTGKSKRPVSVSLFERIQPDAAGIDCGQNSHFVSVPPERDPQPLREFRTFTSDLQRLGGLAGAVRREDCGDGIDRGLLDSAVRDTRAARLRSAAGQRS